MIDLLDIRLSMRLLLRLLLLLVPIWGFLLGDGRGVNFPIYLYIYDI